VGVACVVTWYWLADLWTQARRPFVLGHALSMRAMHGGTTHDTSESHKMAALLRGGMPRQASVDPAEMRATRDRLRRRIPLAHKRREEFFQRYGRRAADPDASRDTQGTNLQAALVTTLSTASVNAKAPLGQDTLSLAPLLGHPLARPCATVLVAKGLRGQQKIAAFDYVHKDAERQ
jgi:hypothetical protein